MADLTRSSLKRMATAVKAKADGREVAKCSRMSQARAKAIAEMVAKCRGAMKEAAKAGKFYREVEIDSGLYEDVAAKLAEFSPSINGDGYTITVICLRWD